MVLFSKKKTIDGFFWASIDTLFNQGIQFFVGLVLARILSPKEFGLIGMLTIFIAVSQTFIDSGFASALIRKKVCSAEDYSTVFYYNLVASLLLFFILFYSAGLIGGFFNEPLLRPMIRFLSFGLIINALGLIPKVILVRRVDFRTQAFASLISSIGSGMIAIVMALQGNGVWSLVALTLSRFFLGMVLVWIASRWVPKRVFSTSSYRNLFAFGWKILASSLLDTIYRNVFYLIIGRFFSASELGFYTRAEQFKGIPSERLAGLVGRVSYPVLSGIQDDKIELKRVYKRLTRDTMFVAFLLMLIMAVVAHPLVVVLIGEKWAITARYLRLLCFVGMMYPLHSLNLNMLQVLGRSDLFLRLEFIKKILAIPTIWAGITWGVEVMIIGMMVNTLVSYVLNSYWSGRLIGYSIREQLSDIIPSFLFALVISAVVYSVGLMLRAGLIWSLLVQLLAAWVILCALGETMHFPAYVSIKGVVHEYLRKMKIWKKRI